MRLSQEHDKQSSEVELMTNKHTILTQKKLRVEAEISSQVAETTDVEREIHRLRIDLLRLNTLRHKERDNETSLERDNQLLENQFMAELKVRVCHGQMQPFKAGTIENLDHITVRVARQHIQKYRTSHPSDSEPGRGPK